jgi:hypothetical protein
MHPYLPFAALPVAVTAAWFVASHWPGSEPGRYRVPAVTQIEDPSVPVNVRSEPVEKPDIRVAAFLPQVPPRPPAPATALILHSVMTGTDMHLATINGQVVKEGDRVEGYLVKRITADDVELAKGGKTRRLPMRPLHELPPPIQPGTDPEQRNAAVQRSRTDLTQNFWATFDSPQPQL